MRVIHLAIPELSHPIGECPWCEEFIYAHQQYAFDEQLDCILHIDCYIARKEAVIERKEKNNAT